MLSKMEVDESVNDPKLGLICFGIKLNSRRKTRSKSEVIS